MKNLMILILTLLLVGCVTDSSSYSNKLCPDQCKTAKISQSMPKLERMDTTKILFREINIQRAFTQIITLYKDSSWEDEIYNVSQDSVHNILIEQYPKFVKVGTFYLNGTHKSQFYCYKEKDSVLTNDVKSCQ